MNNNDSKRLKVFISYRRRNGGIAYAYAIKESLSALGVQCFYDIDSLQQFSDDFLKKIKDEINQSDYVLVLLQPGCMKETEGKDIYLEEIRYSREMDKPLVFIPVDKDFSWENEANNLPSDLTSEPNNITRAQLASPIDFADMKSFTEKILIKMNFNNDSRYLHYLFILQILKNAKESESFSKLIKTSDAHKIDLETRWRNAKRVSLIAIGCSGLIKKFYEIICKKAQEGVEFRFVSVNPKCKASKIVNSSKISVLNPSQNKSFLKSCVSLVSDSLEQMSALDGYNSSLEYRITDDILSCSIQWVECKNDEESYFYVEYLPINAVGTTQDENRAVVVKKNDSAYENYVNQFNRCWTNSKVVIKK